MRGPGCKRWMDMASPRTKDAILLERRGSGNRTGTAGLAIKNGAGPMRCPRRRIIAPTGELAGLPARDFLNLVRPRVSPRGPIHTAKNRGARTRYFVSLYPIFFA